MTPLMLPASLARPTPERYNLCQAEIKAIVCHSSALNYIMLLMLHTEACDEMVSRDFMDKNTLTMDKPGYLGAFILSHPSSLWFTLPHSVSLYYILMPG